MPAGAVVVAGNVKDKAGDFATAVGGAAATSGHFVADTAVTAYSTVNDLTGRTHKTLSKHTVPLLIGLTGQAGNFTNATTQISSLRQVAKNFKFEHWLDISNQIDIEKATRVVAELKAKYPDKSNR